MEEIEENLPYGEPPLEGRLLSAAVAAKTCKADWGPVFVYGSMLYPTAWSALVGFLPECRSATLRGYERRRFHSGGFAGIYKCEDKSVVGMLVSGLMPLERCTIDAVIDDCFYLDEAVVEPTGDAEPRLLITQCGDAEFNGMYLPMGVQDGKPYYQREEPDRKGKFKTVHFESGFWRIDVGYNGFYYKSSWDGKTPPIEDWVIDRDGITPLPRVNQKPMNIECSTYFLRESCMDALGDDDWDFEEFAQVWLDGFCSLCSDTRVRLRQAKLSDDELKDLAFARRRKETGFESSKGQYDVPVDLNDPDAIDPRLGIEFPKGIIRLEVVFPREHLHEEPWTKPWEKPDAKTGRTPQEEVDHLIATEKAELTKKKKTKGIKYPPEAALRDAGAVIEALRNGEIKTWGEEAKPFIFYGLPPTRGSDFVVASVPTKRLDWYTRACIICASFRIGFSDVSEEQLEEIWLWTWKRNVEKAVKEKKMLVVLTRVEKYGGPHDKPGIGALEFRQTVQIAHLQRNEIPFIPIDIVHFCNDMQPALAGAIANNFDIVEQCLMSRREISVPLINVFDHTGRTVMHYAARLGATERVVRTLCDNNEDINVRQWRCDQYGSNWTPLMVAAQQGPTRMIRMLFEAKADAHLENDSGKTAFDLARGREENERMMSQCHWRFCLACKKGRDANEDPPSEATS